MKRSQAGASMTYTKHTATSRLTAQRASVRPMRNEAINEGVSSKTIQNRFQWIRCRDIQKNTAPDSQAKRSSSMRPKTAPRNARPATRAGVSATPRQTCDAAVRNTAHQNQTGPRMAFSSARSPAVEAARSEAITRPRIHSARRILRIGQSWDPTALQQSSIGLLRMCDGRDASRVHGEITFRPTSALRRRIAQARGNQSFIFQAIESSVERTRRRFTPCTRGNLSPYCHSIRVFGQTQNC